MTQEKMTQREFYTELLECNIADHLKEFAQGRINALDKANEKRKNAPRKNNNAESHAELMAEIMGVMTSEPLQAKEIAELIESEVTTQKVTSMIKKLVENGSVKAIEKKAKSHPNKYILA